MSAGQQAEGDSGLRPPRFFAQPHGDVPVWLVKGAVIVAILAIAGGLFSTRTGIGQFETPAIETRISKPVALLDDGGSSVRLVDGDGATLHTYASTEGGFVVESIRNLERNRVRRGITSDAPFNVSLLTDGRLVLQDPLDGAQVELRAFGEENARQFLAILLPSS